MIENIKIKNFKSLKNINLNLTNLNLLVGMNGMGKSSFIQVILLLLQSNNLCSQGELLLSNFLVDIGKGKDALYQFASDEKISIHIKLSDNKEVEWQFNYDPINEKLYSNLNKKTDIISEFEDFQYISANRLGPQLLHNTSISAIKKDFLGVKGEFAAHYLHINGNKQKINEKLKHKKTEELTLFNQVNGWMSEISPGVKINITEVPNIDQIILIYQFELGNGRTDYYKPQNVGYGLSYVLPIIVSLLTSNENKLIILENPESHIHPRGQAELGKLIALAASNGAQLIVETHSDHIINGIRVAVKENQIENNKVNISFFDKITTKDEQFTNIDSIKIDKNGELSEYPQNFLDEWDSQLMRLI